MFVYEKKLQYPVHITTPNPKLAAVIISQYGGPYIISLRKEHPAARAGCSFLIPSAVPVPASASAASVPMSLLLTILS